MREGESGIYYAAEGELGYSLIMLRRTRLNSYYRDPYLFAIWLESGVNDAVEDLGLPGTNATPRSLRLKRSGTRMRCAEGAIAFELRQPRSTPPSSWPRFQQRDDVVEVDDELRLVVQQVKRDGKPIDAEDRVRKGAGLLKELVDAGL